MEGIKVWIRTGNNKYVVLFAVMFILAMVLLVTEAFHKQYTPPPVTQVTDTSPYELQYKIPELTPADSKDLSHQVQRAEASHGYTYQFYTATQEQADKQVQAYAKQDKADKLIKKTEEKQVQGSDQKVIENQYYAINLNRKHDIKAGGAVVDGEAYATVSYRNRDVEYTAAYNPQNGKAGFGVSVAVAKW